MSQNERRQEDRRRCSDPIWWRAEQRDDYRVGWLLERSGEGAAFVVRDSWPPSVTDLLEVHVWHGPDGRKRGRGFVVHRVRPVHADLYLVAGKFVVLEEPMPTIAPGASQEREHGGLAAVEVEALPMEAEADSTVFEEVTSIWHG